MRNIVAVLSIAAALVSGRVVAQDQDAPGSQQPTTAPQKAAPAKKRWQPGRWWLAVGPSGEDIEDAAADCGGGQVAVGLGGRRAFAKLQLTAIGYESRDSTDACKGDGDSLILEDALLVGVSAPSSGLFVALGPARVEVEEIRPAPMVEGTGVRFELGWSSRRWRNSKSRFGVEIALFAVASGARDYTGSTLSLTFGQGGH